MAEAYDTVISNDKHLRGPRNVGFMRLEEGED